jgi:hypothetical protein
MIINESDQVREDEMGQARYVALMGKKVIARRLSVSKPEGKRQLGRPRRR